MTATDPVSWVDDHCGNGRIVPITRERADGILALHESCEPPCPRRISAREYLGVPPESSRPQR
ncbi:hypothetical protein [Nocardia yamanashiensis]|uniref:hypothetical protein n=1 Tax=Nocardia yamanashiensis TaxID=209247 RepID=UPI00082D1A0B|nr:hypothetical protein [Nocardia yamanashiensis]